jgi:predicted ATP-dependent protease
MTTDVTLNDLLTTGVGKQMAAEVEAARQAEAAEVEEKRQAQVDGWLKEIAEVGPKYEALRTEALRLLAELAPHAGRLCELRFKLRALAGYVRKYGGQVKGYPEPLPERELRQAIDAVREILNRLGRGL